MTIKSLQYLFSQFGYVRPIAGILQQVLLNQNVRFRIGEAQRPDFEASLKESGHLRLFFCRAETGKKSFQQLALLRDACSIIRVTRGQLLDLRSKVSRSRQGLRVSVEGIDALPLSPCVSELVSRLEGQAEKLIRFRSCGGGILFFWA